MTFFMGIRREDKNKWERRVPIIPNHVKKLKNDFNIKTIVQPSNRRIFSNDEYESSDAFIKEDLSDCNVIFAVKEIPVDLLIPEKTYVFFSHTIKGQKYNMPMLKEMMSLRCNLIDYEKICDEKGRRLVFFGRYAGLAGMIDTLWAFGQRMKNIVADNPFSKIKKTLDYKDLDDAKKEISKLGMEIKEKGIDDLLSPIIIGFAGYGNVSIGAQEILDLLPVKEIKAKDLQKISKIDTKNFIYKVVFKEEDIVKRNSNEENFKLQEYYNKPELYHSQFEQYLGKLSILMNCIYWDKRYPRLITKEYIRKNYSEDSKLKVIGDISVDINGAIEFTDKTTNSDNPAFIYDFENGKITEGFDKKGIVVMAVDNLPCELPKESSIEFSNSLIDFVPPIVKTDYSLIFDELKLPPEIKKALILHQGKLTPDYQYINKFL